MAPILYKLAASPPSNAVLILADIIGLKLEVRDLNIFPLESGVSAGRLKLNPMSTVPVLIEGKFIISESHAIMKYLVSKYGGQKAKMLYPSDMRTRALVDQAMFFDASLAKYLPIFYISPKAIEFPVPFYDQDGPTATVKTAIDKAYGVVEASLGAHAYIATDHLTIADISLAATIFAMQPVHNLDPDKFPRTAAWKARLEEHPSVKEHLSLCTMVLDGIITLALTTTPVYRII
ncbi:hypothetical protein PYW07_001379 [Mythimna separata]|uniref:Glutathione transferase n=1 Tax=Mythimna separata TaxID=271217 RepID=A0AAD7YV45_MYTSE|nr:hypothetical protein PYW07_001379 [Mythimna separata]